MRGNKSIEKITHERLSISLKIFCQLQMNDHFEVKDNGCTERYKEKLIKKGAHKHLKMIISSNTSVGIFNNMM